MCAQRDPAGPEHYPTINESHSIEGVITQKFPSVKSINTEDNFVHELYRGNWIGMFHKDEPIEHLYVVTAKNASKRQEWYWHEHSTDRYILLCGQLDVGLYDSRIDSKTFGKFEKIRLGAIESELPSGLRIPVNVWHSLKWNTKNNLLLNCKNPPYNRDIPDKFRIPTNELPKNIIW